MNRMKRFSFLLLLLVMAIITAGFLTRPVSLDPGALPGHQPNPGNGRMLYFAAGCGSCHASPDSDSEPPLLEGGLELATEFGTFVAPNITPHEEEGIGAWSMLDFVNAMRYGVSPDKRHYYPSFPYASYQRMTLEDLMDLKSYLDTLPVSDIPSAGHRLGFPWNLRRGIGLWKRFNLDPSFVVPVDENNASLLRGRYLVEGPGHCGECHTRRDWTGGMDTAFWLAGAESLEGEGSIPDITPAGKNVKDWSAGDIAYYLSSGFTPDFDSVGGTMVKVQENMAQLSDEDRTAIADYLKAVPLTGHPRRP